MSLAILLVGWAVGSEDVSAKAASASDEWKDLPDIEIPGADIRTYKAMECKNGIKLITVKASDEEEAIYTRVVFNTGDVAESEVQAVRDVLSFYMKTKGLWKRYGGDVSLIEDSDLMFLEFWASKNTMKEKLKQLLKCFKKMETVDSSNSAICENSNMDIGSIWTKYIINTRMSVILYGDIDAECLKSAREMVAKIRSEPEREVDVERRNAKTEILLKRYTATPEVYGTFGAEGSRSIILDKVLGHEQRNISKVFLFHVISWIVNGKPDNLQQQHEPDTELQDVIKGYGVCRFRSWFSVHSDKAIKCRFAIEAGKSKTGFRDYEEVISAVVATLKRRRIDDSEYDAFVEKVEDALTDALGNIGYGYGRYQIVELLMRGSMYFEPENYINFVTPTLRGYTSDDVNSLLDTILDVSEWDITVLHSDVTSEATPEELMSHRTIKSLSADEKKKIARMSEESPSLFY